MGVLKVLLLSRYSNLPATIRLDILIYGAPGRNRTHALALQERTSTIKDTRANETLTVASRGFIS
jgi:hypothetical protein